MEFLPLKIVQFYKSLLVLSFAKVTSFTKFLPLSRFARKILFAFTFALCVYTTIVHWTCHDTSSRPKIVVNCILFALFLGILDSYHVISCEVDNSFSNHLTQKYCSVVGLLRRKKLTNFRPYVRELYCKRRVIKWRRITSIIYDIIL